MVLLGEGCIEAAKSLVLRDHGIVDKRHGSLTEFRSGRLFHLPDLLERVGLHVEVALILNELSFLNQTANGVQEISIVHCVVLLTVDFE